MKKGICKYYGRSVVFKENCAKNINVRKLVGGQDFGWLIRTPCFKDHKIAIKCDEYIDPTEKEIKEAEKLMKKTIDPVSKK